MKPHSEWTRWERWRMAQSHWFYFAWCIAKWRLCRVADYWHAQRTCYGWLWLLGIRNWTGKT